MKLKALPSIALLAHPLFLAESLLQMGFCFSKCKLCLSKRIFLLRLPQSAPPRSQPRLWSTQRLDGCWSVQHRCRLITPTVPHSGHRQHPASWSWLLGGMVMVQPQLRDVGVSFLDPMARRSPSLAEVISRFPSCWEASPVITWPLITRTGRCWVHMPP